MRSLLLTSLLVTLGCGPAIADHSDFRRIQRAEARVEEGVRTATDDSKKCEVRCKGQQKACDGSAEVCDIADDTGDKDALDRCQRTRRQCDAAELRTRPSCDC